MLDGVLADHGVQTAILLGKWVIPAWYISDTAGDVTALETASVIVSIANKGSPNCGYPRLCVLDLVSSAPLTYLGSYGGLPSLFSIEEYSGRLILTIFKSGRDMGATKMFSSTLTSIPSNRKVSST